MEPLPLWKIFQAQTGGPIDSNRLKTWEFTFTPFRSTTFALLPSRTQHSALDRLDSTRGGLLVGLTFSESNVNGPAYLSLPMTWSSHRVKRSVSASLAGEVFMISEGLAEGNFGNCSMVSEGLAEGEWIQGAIEIGSPSRLRPVLALSTFSSTSFR